MNVLGVCTSPDGIRWALASGTRSLPQLRDMERNILRLPDIEDETAKLMNVLRFLSTLIKEKDIEKVVVATVGHSQYGGPSTVRVKIECVVQLAAAETAVAVELIAPKTLKAREKKLSAEAGGSAEEILNNSHDFSPRAGRDAVIAAWAGLPE